MSTEVVHDPHLSVNPLHANGINMLVITDSTGAVIGIWDGKDSSGRIVFPGTYTVQVKTKDEDGNEYIVNRYVDVITETTAHADVKVVYGAGFITIFGAAQNTGGLTIRIYNIKGEMIKKAGVLVSGGTYSLTWDMRTTSGNKTANGIYAVVVEFKDINTGIISRKIERIAVK
jgi:flagellar hook assembly protein FlgD